MTILVHNCFHWIGYHYVNFLLEKGMLVKGVDKIDTNKKENLYMLVGRNSSFELIDPERDSKAEVTIVIDQFHANTSFESDKIILIDIKGLKKSLKNATVIKAPLLYGEWMDMTENGLKLGNRFTRFDSDEFQSEAVYIGDFIKATYPLFTSSVNSSKINVFSKKIFLNESVKLENSIYIHDNIPIEENLRKVLAHYERYKDYY